MADPYSVLGLQKTASQQEIKSAYRKLAKELHPDLNPGDAAVERRFKDVSAAYDLLSDEDKRARYDRGEIDAEGKQRAPEGFWRPGGHGRGEGMEEVFSDIFETFANRGFGGRQRRGPMRRRGNDIHAKAVVDFKTIARGGSVTVTLPTKKTVSVRIPPGTEEGARMKLAGQGADGSHGGAPGDAYVEIAVRPHEHMTRDGDDIRVDVMVPLRDAVKGGKVRVPTVDGDVSLAIPAWSNSGKVLRLRGKGIGHASGRRGDQFVRLMITLPEERASDLEALFSDEGAEAQKA